MAKADPLVISFFATGLYTHRSQLFSPYRSVGVNVVTYHDAAIDGQDMELTTLLQWTRRPGFSRFCPTAFGVSEIPIQFYSARQPSGAVSAFVDTNQNFSTFTSSVLTPLFAKSTTAQGFIQQIGSTTYYANGKDFKKWNGVIGAGNIISNFGIPAPTTAPGVIMVSPTRFWAANVGFTLAGCLVDNNGNLQRGGAGITGATYPVWTTVRGAATTDGTFVWTCLGTPGAWTASTSYPAFASIIDPSGYVQANLGGAGVSGASLPAFSTALNATSADNTVTWTNLGTSNQVTQAGYLYAYAYRSIWGHLSTASPISPTTGPAAGATYSATISGSGSSDPQYFQVLPITNIAITNNIVTVTFSGTTVNLVPGQNYSFSGVGTATFLNGNSVNVLSVVGSTFTAAFIHANYASAPDTGNASFNGVEIYRNADGGGILYFAGSVVNPGAGSGWTFVDSSADGALLINLVAPLAHLNDPPPGAPGSLVTTGGTIMAYWQGRMWMAVGNKLFFNAGPDCINGVPEESWPPANVFQYSGPILGLSRTSQGLLVWGADYVSMALGGPQTLSFFPYDLMQNFGISSPNCITQDGDIISVLNTAGQCWTLDVSGKDETGNYVIEVLSATFAPNTSYVSFHRQGQDSALWLSDGSTNAMRYGLNIKAWSTKYVPVGGMKALKSIETSVGVNTLCAGRATGGGYILGRNLNTWQDDGQNYSNCFVTIGNIVLTPPGGRLVPVQHIVGYFDAVGTIGGGPTIPSVAILFNEVSGTPGVGFLTLSGPVSEYTSGSAPSTTLQSLRWPVDSMTSGLVSQLAHHVQIKVSFAAENAPNSIKSLAIMFEKDA